MLKFEVPHGLPVEEAKKRVEALLAAWNKKYGVKAVWTGDTAKLEGSAMGVSVNGHLTVLAGKVGGESTDPGILLRGQAQKYLTRKFGEYLDPSRSLDAVIKADT